MYIKPNNLTDLWDKWGKKWSLDQYEEKKIKGKPQYLYFSRVVVKFLDLLLEQVVEEGRDVNVPYFGTFMARQVKNGDFRCKRYSRNFEFCGGREYTIHDLMNRFNKYPVFTFRNDGSVRARTAMWKAHITPKARWRHRLFQKFYDEGFDYKNLRYLTEAEWKRNIGKVIWRNGMRVQIK